ncbi:MAG: thermonuclease family protein [Verrucomicrobia bacterium]|nr:thermonuclease family protein [Verrucomicrobiota bacterium]
MRAEPDRGPDRLWARVFTLICYGVIMAFGQMARGGTWNSRYECTLVENTYNDGDSFHVRWHGREYIFRLYYVDTPESDASLVERVAEQAEYWGVEPRRIPVLAKEATAFTAAFLKDGFTVYTQYDTARGRSKLKRYYGMVKVGDQYLSEALVRAGYARVYGNYVDILPDGTSDETYLTRLRAAERKARSEELGGWAKDKPEKAIGKGGALKGSIVIDRSVILYSLESPPRRLGTLTNGTTLQVLEDRESPTMVRVIYDKDGTSVEGQCMRSALAGARAAEPVDTGP